MKNFIINLLDLKLEDLKSFDINDLGDKVIITITLSRTSQRCPSCFRNVSKIKERKKHLSIRLLIVEIHILFITQEDMYAPIAEKHLMKTIPTIKHIVVLPMPL
jgi:hypothetical protein